MPRAAKVERTRTKAWDTTHRAIIAQAVKQVSDNGAEALSLVALAKSLGLDRTTLYYHFADREALLSAVCDWSAAQLSGAFDRARPRGARTEYISRFVLENPNLMQLWIEDFLKPGDIRTRYPQWDALVAGIAANLAHHDPPIDAEVYCTIMLTAAYIAPQVFKNSVRPELGLDTIVGLFKREQVRVLAADADLSEASFNE